MLLGRDPERWRVDPVGNVVCAKLTSCEGCLCHEYDHIVPFSKGKQMLAVATGMSHVLARGHNDG